MARAIAAGGSDKGKTRGSNDDAFRIYFDTEVRARARGSVFAVADGIGSYRAGGQAATMAVDQLALYFQFPDARFRGSKTLEELVFKANSVITMMRTRQEGYYGMGCTLTALLVDGAATRGVIYHAGDSMAFLVRDGQLAPITTAQQGDGSSLTNHLGLGDRFKIEKVGVVFKPGDTILLCSDGVSGPLSLDELLELLTLSDDPRECVDSLIERSIEKGDDNVTALVIKIVQ